MLESRNVGLFDVWVLGLAVFFVTDAERVLSVDAVRMVRDRGISRYSDLVFAVLDDGSPELYDWVITHTLFLGELCESNRMNALGVARHAG